MTFLDKIKGFLISRKDRQIERSADSVEIDAYQKGKTSRINPIEIDISNAIRIDLPKLKYEKEPDPYEMVKQDWPMYYEILQKAQSHYKREWFDKAKEEFLKIYDFYHKDKMYYTYLLRTYRKIIDRFIEKKKFDEALLEFDEMFKKCVTWYLYILKNDITIKYIKNNNELFRWYDNGFVQQRKNDVVFYDTKGNNLGKLSFKSPINQICFNNDIILVETTTKAFTFKMDIKAT